MTKGTGDPDTAVPHHCDQMPPVQQHSPAARIQQISEALDVGIAVIQPPAQRAENQKLPAAPADTGLNGQHGVGVILPHRKDLGAGRNLPRIQGIHVPQNQLRGHPQHPSVSQAAIGSNHQVIRPGRPEPGKGFGRLQWPACQNDTAGTGERSIKANRFGHDFLPPSRCQSGI